MSCIIGICGTLIQSAASTQSYLRSTMSQRRLNCPLVSSTYTDKLDQLDMQLLLDDFITRDDYTVDILLHCVIRSTEWY